ncbi:DUF72 domain-containing protein [Thermoflavifilum thermophilum]|uniref:Uncharacterized conserved protein YecE, DUF72 family n=1 Tax=Thermoflavifilum thermophilum TaxID=1393122 RepID=A0A1I7NDU8_9BACT|nr:DUF72 domain-containing protein [Thermoflavifilum thermophilum]SFV32829.1 Uncharacterized conserved protein YecE, DUF72 family [Thermoflavifilum thermophilum]
MPRIYIGTSGFAYSSWVGSFYPAGTPRDEWLAYYARYFPAVEINASFYHTPRISTIRKWAAQTPDSFSFSFKLSRYVTHIQRLQCDQTSLDKFFAPLEPALVKSTPPVILIQLPSSLKPDFIVLQNFLEKLPAGFRYAIEFRHPSWFQPETYTLLRKHDMALVLADSPISTKGTRKWPLVNENTATFFYIRMHGSKVLFTSSYSEEELAYYASLVKQKWEAGQDVYVFFNNDAAGHAVENARTLQRLLQTSGVPDG